MDIQDSLHGAFHSAQLIKEYNDLISKKDEWVWEKCGLPQIRISDLFTKENHTYHL